jgi:uncharacterized membrane protein HdeD (DUF308 family)
MSEHTGGRGHDDPGLEFVAATRTTTLAEHWGLVMAYGVLTFAIGAVLAAWPGETLKVLAILLAIQLILMGSVQMFLALGSASYERNRRWVVGLTGVLAVVIGVLCLTDPIQTLKVIGILIGIGDLVGAFLPSTPGSRIWDIVKGVVSIGAGIFLVANPKVSLGFLVIVTCVWLLGYGFIIIVGALRLRTEHIHSLHPAS